MRIEPTEKDIENVYKIYLDQSKIDHEKGQLKLGDLPIIWARADLLYNMYLELRKVVGESANPLMRKMGKPYGRNFFRTLGRALMSAHGSADEEALLNFLAAENAVIGWGRISIEREDGRWVIVCKNGFPVAQSFRSKKMFSTVPVDSYFLGYFEGFVTELEGEKYIGRETKCLALGDDQCRMVFERKDSKPPKVVEEEPEEEDKIEPDYSE
jgi:predicted hydrocarbon binding protein